MNKEQVRNWRKFEIAREKVKETIDDLDGDVFMTEEIDVTFEYIQTSINQLKEFWETNLKK